MLKKRLIPKILARRPSDGRDLWSAGVTVGYEKFVSIGSMNSQVRIFESNKVDEIILINIEKNNESSVADFSKVLKDLIPQLMTPLTAGGSIECISDADRLVSSGADKLLCGLSQNRFGLFSQIANKFGSQALVASLDYAISGKAILHRNDDIELSYLQIKSTIDRALECGVGEIVLNCVQRDGSRNGFHLELLESLAGEIPAPLIISSGAGKPEHFTDAFNCGASGVAAGTYFAKLDQNPLQLRSRLLNQNITLRKLN